MSGAQVFSSRVHSTPIQEVGQKMPAVHSSLGELDTAVSSLGGAVDALLARLGPIQHQIPTDRPPPNATAVGRQPRGVPVADQILEVSNRLDRFADQIREALSVLEV